MRLNTIRIPCLNLDEAEIFYSTLLEREKAFGSAQESYTGFNIDNVTVLLEPTEEGEFEAGHYLGFSLETEDIDSFYLAMKERGVKFTGTPIKQAWGGMMTHIEDCSGNTFSIVQARRATPDV